MKSSYIPSANDKSKNIILCLNDQENIIFLKYVVHIHTNGCQDKS